MSFDLWDNGFLISTRNYIDGESASSFTSIDENLDLRSTDHYMGVFVTRQSPFFNQQDSTFIGIGDNEVGDGQHGFIKLDKNFSELSKKTFNSSSSNSGVTSTTFKNGYLYAVIVDVFQGPLYRDLKILKVDSCGNFIWMKSMEVGYEYDHNFDITSTEDGNLVLAREIADESNDRRAHISLISPDGEILWESLNPELKEISGIWVETLSNGNIISSMSLDKRLDESYLFDFLYPIPPEIRWYSEDGVELHQVILNSPRYEGIFVEKLIKGKGDYFFGVGYRNPGENDLPGFYGWIFKMDNEGNMIWNRKYYHPDYHELDFSHYIDKLIELDNGDIITAGVVRDPGVEGEIWVMRLNADGCLGDDCGEAITSSTAEISDDSESIVTYPNPSNGLINFKTQLTVDYLRVVDASGTVVHKQQSFSGRQLDLTFLGDGMYWITMQRKEGGVERVSIVVKH